MLRDGKYAAWFRTSRGQGTGVVHLAQGRFSGNDCFFSYAGTYQVEQDRFTAVLTTRRHADGMPTVFGVDEVEVHLSGACSGAVANCCGRAKQAPDVRREVTLIYSQDGEPAADAGGAVVKLRSDKAARKDGRSRLAQQMAASPSEDSLT